MPFRLHTFAEPQLQANYSRQGPAVLAAGTGWKLFDFLGFCVLPGNETVNFRFCRVEVEGRGWHFSVTYNVSFT